MNKNIIDNIFSALQRAYSFVPVVKKMSTSNMSPFKILITAMISSRTKDEVTAIASSKLFLLADNPKKMLELSDEQIMQAIYPVGFYKEKSQNIVAISNILKNKFKNKVPSSIDELTSMPGVGIKTATLVLIEAYDVDEICVDIHVHRISNRIGFIKTKKPEESRLALKKIIPKKYWKSINNLMVSYGKTICRPVGPKCKECVIVNFCKKNI